MIPKEQRDMATEILHFLSCSGSGHTITIGRGDNPPPVKVYDLQLKQFVERALADHQEVMRIKWFFRNLLEKDKSYDLVEQ